MGRGVLHGELVATEGAEAEGQQKERALSRAERQGWRSPVYGHRATWPPCVLRQSRCAGTGDRPVGRPGRDDDHATDSVAHGAVRGGVCCEGIAGPPTTLITSRRASRRPDFLPISCDGVQRIWKPHHDGFDPTPVRESRSRLSDVGFVRFPVFLASASRRPIYVYIGRRSLNASQPRTIR